MEWCWIPESGESEDFKKSIHKKMSLEMRDKMLIHPI